MRDNSMENRLVLENQEGKVVRAYQWSGDKAYVVRRADTQRLEVVSRLDFLNQQKISFENLGEISAESVKKNPMKLGALGHLKFIEPTDLAQSDIQTDIQSESEKDRSREILMSFLVLSLIFMTVVMSRPDMTPKIEEELKQQVVQIVKSMPPKQDLKPKSMTMTQPNAMTAKTATTQKTEAIKRMGALSALGSLNKGSQKGGLNLGAAQTSAGPGLGGGTQGSGGVQTSLYGKGITSAPLGAGHNIQGAGGYGTKGKGGGQAGYGTLSLVGSAGAQPIPLGQEATVASGLDRDQIAAVIAKNMGQVRFCYEQGLQSEPNIQGRVSVDFTINGQGLVKSANVGSTTLNAKSVEDCMVLRLKSWKFPLPQGGVDVKVSYPFVLKRAGQG